jgi:hypothetical protein
MVAMSLAIVEVALLYQQFVKGGYLVLSCILFSNVGILKLMCYDPHVLVHISTNDNRISGDFVQLLPHWDTQYGSCIIFEPEGT